MHGHSELVAFALCALYIVKSVFLVIFKNMFLNAIFFLAALKLAFHLSAVYIKPEKYVVFDILSQLSLKHEPQVQC